MIKKLLLLSIFLIGCSSTEVINPQSLNNSSTKTDQIISPASKSVPTPNIPSSKPSTTETSKSTSAPTSKMTGRERLLSIEFNIPKQGTLNELKQEYVASTDIPEKYRTRFIEIQNNLNSIIGGYPRYIYVAFNKNGTDVDNKPVLDKLAEVDYDGFGKTKFSVSDIVQSCLSGAGELRTYDANPYNLCVEDFEFIENPWGEQGAEDFEIESYVKMALHLAHEYFHHYQNAHALDRGLSYDRDRDNPESTVQAPDWWLEGAAITFQNAWWKQNWQDLPTLKDKKWSDVSSWTIAGVAGDDQYKETRNSIINNEENSGCDANWYISEKDNLSMSECGGSIMATAYLAHLTSYQTVWVDIPRDYYELGFWGALKKYIGMNQQEFFDSYNKFLRAGNPDDEPPAGWSPNEQEINKYADFLNILTSNSLSYSEKKAKAKSDADAKTRADAKAKAKADAETRADADVKADNSSKSKPSSMLKTITTLKKQNSSIDLTGENFEIDLIQTIDGEEHTRKTLIRMPFDFDSNKIYPLMFTFHGHGGNAEEFIPFVNDICVEQSECIGVIPNGHQNSWNLGSEAESTADELAFVSDIIYDLSKYKQVDINNVFGFGHSNGSGLVHDLATRSIIFRGIAPFSSALIIGRTVPGEINNIVSVFQYHGMNDDLIPYNGGQSEISHKFISAEESVDLWAKNNKCNNVEKSQTNDGSIRIEYLNCKDASRIIHYGLKQAGHGIELELFQNQFNSSMIDEMWEFFKSVTIK